MSNKYTAWNPGLESNLPREYLDQETIFRSNNVSTGYDYVAEVTKLTGLDSEELVVFKPERLVLHELIVRVTADVAVLEGDKEEELGRNFRQIVTTILINYIQPHMPEIRQAYVQLQEHVQFLVRKELSETLFRAEGAQSGGNSSTLFNFFSRSKKRQVRQETTVEKECRVVSSYKEMGLATDDPLNNAIYRSLYRVLGSTASSRGFIGSDKSLLVKLVSNHVCNGYGSQMIGDIITSYIEAAIQQEGYRLTSNSVAPMLISLKGASAAGKSSLRPMLQKMMFEKGIELEGYATISPDIWRRLLLDYDSLGAACKYAGRFTSSEVNIIDSKLDYYIRDKADRHRSIPHLVVDRFRFDSFSSKNISRILHDTYVKYVDTLQMYFVVTPPEITVERGWQRGIEQGRYKAVEDYLGHSLEAYLGMPRIFFKWLAHKKPHFKYRFLDNSIPKGTYPKTIAFGTQNVMNILNPVAFVDIERYQKINIKAKFPEEVYPADSAMALKNNISFLKQSIICIPCVNFVDEKSNRVYVRAQEGTFEIMDAQLFKRMQELEDVARIFLELAPNIIATKP